MKKRWLRFSSDLSARCSSLDFHPRRAKEIEHGNVIVSCVPQHLLLIGGLPSNLSGSTYQVSKFLKHTVPSTSAQTTGVFSDPSFAAYSNYLISSSASGSVEVDDSGRTTGLVRRHDQWRRKGNPSERHGCGPGHTIAQRFTAFDRLSPIRAVEVREVWGSSSRLERKDGKAEEAFASPALSEVQHRSNEKQHV